MNLSVTYDFLPRTNSTRASRVMDHFGINFEQGQHVVAENLEVPIEPGCLTLFTGESGSGKSSLMKAAAERLREQGESVLNVDDLDLGDRLLVDRLPLKFEESLQWLSACGLGEAHLMLRTPRELSDGQRYRFRLAVALAEQPDWILADEFTATLDRRLARVIAANLRKICSRVKTGFLLATTHEDVVADLNPDVHITCRLDGGIQVDSGESMVLNADADDRKKKVAASSPTSGSPAVPRPTGRTSLGGIIAATASG